MAMVPAVRATAVLSVTHGRYNVEDDGFPSPGVDDADRVILPGLEPENGAVIAAGTFYGPVEVAVEVLDAAPEDDRGGGWERVEDITLTAAGDQIGVFSWESGEDEPPDLPELTVTPGSRCLQLAVSSADSCGQPRPPRCPARPGVVIARSAQAVARARACVGYRSGQLSRSARSSRSHAAARAR